MVVPSSLVRRAFMDRRNHLWARRRTGDALEVLGDSIHGRSRTGMRTVAILLSAIDIAGYLFRTNRRIVAGGALYHVDGLRLFAAPTAAPPEREAWFVSMAGARVLAANRSSSWPHAGAPPHALGAPLLF